MTINTLIGAFCLCLLLSPYISSGYNSTDLNNVTIKAQRCFCDDPAEVYIFKDQKDVKRQCVKTDFSLLDIVNVPPFGTFEISPIIFDKCQIFPIDIKEDISFVRNYTALTIGSTKIERPFCIERIQSFTNDMNLFSCFVDEDIGTTESDKYVFIVYAAGMLFSLPCLIFTFLIYALIPELRNLHGKVLMSHVACMIVAFVFLALVQLHQDVDECVCLFSAIIIHFAFLGSFFWLHIMCFDIWWTFSGFRGLRGSPRERERRKFIIYSVYAWTCPLIIVVISLIMNYHPDVSDDFKPLYGVGTCLFGSKNGNLIYFYVPIGLIIISNSVMFMATAFKLIQLKRETAMLRRNDSRSHNINNEVNKEKCKLYFKLFVVMGINWSMELLSWIIDESSKWWLLTDIFNCLQGVLIFLIFVCKPKIIRLLRKRFCPGGVERASSNQTRSFSMYTKNSNNSTSHPMMMNSEN